MSEISKKFIFTSLILNLLTLTVIIFLAAGGAVGLVLKYAIDPNHERLESQHEMFTVNKGDIVFLGDSITEGGIWFEWFPDKNIRQRGIGGDTTSGVIARLEPIVSGQPAKVFLLIGTNDIFFGVTDEEIIENIDAIIASFNEKSPQTKIYLQSILPRAKSYKARIENLNVALENLAEENSTVTWINLYPLFLDEAKESIDDSLSNDELHLMGEGYKIWIDVIKKYV